MYGQSDSDCDTLRVAVNLWHVPQEELDKVNEQPGMILLWQWTYVEVEQMNACCLSWNKVWILHTPLPVCLPTRTASCTGESE